MLASLANIAEPIPNLLGHPVVIYVAINVIFQKTFWVEKAYGIVMSMIDGFVETFLMLRVRHLHTRQAGSILTNGITHTVAKSQFLSINSYFQKAHFSKNSYF